MASCSAQDALDIDLDRNPFRILPSRSISSLEGRHRLSNATWIPVDASPALESQPPWPVHLADDSLPTPLDVSHLLGPVGADDPNQAVSVVIGEGDRNNVGCAVETHGGERAQVRFGEKLQICFA